MNDQELDKALIDIAEKQRVADRAADTCARLLVGRLRHVSSYRLKKLKKELAQFNAHTGNWSDQ